MSVYGGVDYGALEAPRQQLAEAFGYGFERYTLPRESRQGLEKDGLGASCGTFATGPCAPTGGSGTGSGIGAGADKAAQPEAPQDPWARFADILAGMGGGGGITLPSSQPQSITYVPTTGRSPLALLLLVIGLGGAGYWWYKKQKGGGS